MKQLGLFLLLLFCMQDETAAQLRVAVASNFYHTAVELAARYEQKTGEEVDLVPGSTGKLFAQITHGAPFDVFLAADAESAERVAESKRGGSEAMTYAQGRIAVWSEKAEIGSDPMTLLNNPLSGKLAIANPAVAPYGRAAREALESCSFAQWEQLVFGENVIQTHHFVNSGNAEYCIISLAQAQSVNGSFTAIPETAHSPIIQKMVAVSQRGEITPGALRFLEFMQSPQARAVISAAGYTN